MRGAGTALPWIDLAAFARRAVEMSAADRTRVGNVDGWTFFDRGLVDAAVALEHAAGVAAAKTLAGLDRFHDQVFLTPPWPEIYRADRERRLDPQDGIAEYHRLRDACVRLGYDPVILPRVAAEARADFVLSCLSWARRPQAAPSGPGHSPPVSRRDSAAQSSRPSPRARYSPARRSRSGGSAARRSTATQRAQSGAMLQPGWPTRAVGRR